MEEPTSVSELLQRAELGQYAAAFEDQGYDSMSQLCGINEEDLVDLIREVKMKPGHVKRLRAVYSVARAAPIQRRIQETCCITRVTALYSGGSSSHGFVELYSYTARAYTAALYRIQPIHYTALYADPLQITPPRM